MNSFFFNIKIPSFHSILSLPYFTKDEDRDKKKIKLPPSLTNQPNPFNLRKPLIISKEMSEYIRKSTESSIEKQKQRQPMTNGNVTFSRKLECVYPNEEDENNVHEYDLTIHKELNQLINSYKKKTNSSLFFSPELFYEVGYQLYQNIHFYSYLGLFTGFFIIYWKREKIEWRHLFSKRFF